MQVLVLGAGGFIGSHLVERLLIDNNNVIGVDQSDEKIPQLVKNKMRFFCWDIRDHHSSLNELIAEADLVIDLIAYANPIIYLQRPIDVVNVNFFENLFVAQCCSRLNKRLIQFSTCEVYGMSGGTKKPFSEDETPLIMGPVCNHRWIYASGKQFLERIIHAYGLAGELDYTIIRPFNFIGPRMDYLIQGLKDGIPRVFPIFLSALIFGMPMHLVDGGTQKRTFTYISDAIDATMIILQNRGGVFDRQICNIGNPRNETDIRTLATTMIHYYEKISGEKYHHPVLAVPGIEFYGSGYQDCDRRIPDIKKLRRLGWQPKVNLEEAIQKTIEYYLLEKQRGNSLLQFA